MSPSSTTFALAICPGIPNCCWCQTTSSSKNSSRGSPSSRSGAAYRTSSNNAHGLFDPAHRRREPEAVGPALGEMVDAVREHLAAAMPLRHELLGPRGRRLPEDRHPDTLPARVPAPVPAVTALLPVKHFEERFLNEAVASIFDQTEPAWRLLIITEPAGPAGAASRARRTADRPARRDRRLRGPQARGQLQHRDAPRATPRSSRSCSATTCGRRRRSRA